MTTRPPPLPLADALRDKLANAIRGPVFLRGDRNFTEYSTIFNGNVMTPAGAVVCPLDAEDVSNIILFCNKHGLSPSMKGGGYGIAGWAVNGDIIIDLSRLTDIDIEPPKEDGSFTSLRDIVAINTKGKRRVDDANGPEGGGEKPGTIQSGKRLREKDAALRSYDDASRAVASFLQNPLAPETARRHLEVQDGVMKESSTSGRALTEGGGEVFDVVDPAAIAPPPPPSPSPFLGEPAEDLARLRNPQRAASSISLSTASASPTGERPFLRGGSSPSSSRDATTSPGTPFNASPRVSPHSTNATSPSPARSPLATYTNPPASSSAGFLPRISSASSLPPTRPALVGGPFSYMSESRRAPPPVLLGRFDSPAPLRSWSVSAPGLLMSPTDSPMSTSLLRPEPIHTHAYVTFGAGKRQKEIDTFTAQHKFEGKNGIGIPYHVPFAAYPTGASVVLLGGFGFLSRLHGLSSDNLVEVEMVLADGRIVIVSETEHPDLWWALRGAGTAFGVATRFKAKAYPVPIVFAGNLIYRFNKATAPSLIKHYRDCIKGAPRELYANVLLTTGPAGKDSLVVIQMCYVGVKERGEEFLSAISSWDGEACLLNEIAEKSFLNQQDSIAQVLRGRAGKQWFIRSAPISSLPDDLINDIVTQFANAPVGCMWLFELAGGAINEHETCIPKSQREAAFTIAALHQWEMDVDDDRCIDSAEEWIADTLHPVQLGGPLPSFLGRLEPPERVRACFGESWERLCEIKRKYDPDNVFRNSFWPCNAAGDLVDPSMHEPPHTLRRWL